jgi:hypothetical protein
MTNIWANHMDFFRRTPRQMFLHALTKPLQAACFRFMVVKRHELHTAGPWIAHFRQAYTLFLI